MVFGTDGEFALKPCELSRCNDDPAPDVLEWIYFSGWLQIAELQCSKIVGNDGEQDA